MYIHVHVHTNVHVHVQYMYLISSVKLMMVLTNFFLRCCNLGKYLFRMNVHKYLYLFSTLINPPTFGTFFIQVDAPFESIRYCGFEW